MQIVCAARQPALSVGARSGQSAYALQPKQADHVTALPPAAGRGGARAFASAR